MQQKPSEKREETEPESGTVAKGGARRLAMTMNARAGLDASEIVNAAFGKRTIGSSTPRKLEIVEPDGPSTAGGRRARQTIRLVASNGAAPIMIGSLDVAQKAVELRSYASVEAQHEERFHQKLDFSSDEYVKLSKDLQLTLHPFRYTFEVEAPDATDTRAKLTGQTSKRAVVMNTIMLGVVALVFAGLALALMR